MNRVTLYRRDLDVWRAAKTRADALRLSLSGYVEYALRKDALSEAYHKVIVDGIEYRAVIPVVPLDEREFKQAVLEAVLDGIKRGRSGPIV